MALILRLCHRITSSITAGRSPRTAPEEVRKNPRAIEAYLGAAAGSDSDTAETAMLRVDGLAARYGPRRRVALRLVQDVQPGEIVRSSARTAPGSLRPSPRSAGRSCRPQESTPLRRREPLGLSPERIVRREGGARARGAPISRHLTVEENLLLGATDAPDRPRRRRAGWRPPLDRFPVLRDRLQGYAGLLSGGEQQQLAIARALMSGPRFCCSTSPRSVLRRR